MPPKRHQVKGRTGGNITLYVRDADEQVWERARRLAQGGDESLSAIATAALGDYIARKERDAAARKMQEGKMKHVEFSVQTRQGTEKVRFTGVLLTRESGKHPTYEGPDGRPSGAHFEDVEVYRTPAGKIVVLRTHVRGAVIPERKPAYPNAVVPVNVVRQNDQPVKIVGYSVYSGLEEMRQKSAMSADMIDEVYKALGEGFVVEID